LTPIKPKLADAPNADHNFASHNATPGIPTDRDRDRSEKYGLQYSDHQMSPERGTVRISSTALQRMLSFVLALQVNLGSQKQKPLRLLRAGRFTSAAFCLEEDLGAKLS